MCSFPVCLRFYCILALNCFDFLYFLGVGLLIFPYSSGIVCSHFSGILCIGMDIDIRNIRKETPLFDAVANNHLDIVSRLLSKGKLYFSQIRLFPKGELRIKPHGSKILVVFVPIGNDRGNFHKLLVAFLKRR